MEKGARKPKVIVTSALPYSNGSIHIGHLVEYIQTDIYVRFLRLRGEDVVYCCADDTHGTAIEIKAHELKITPQELIAKVSAEHQEDFSSFHIRFDSYYSTNSPENKALSDMIFSKAVEKGLIYTKEVDLLFDEKAKRFLPDRYIKGECPKCHAKDQYGDVCEICGSTHSPMELINPYSSLTGATPARRTSSHYFFKLSALSDRLKEWLEGNDHLQPEIKNYVLNWIKDGLQDWDITRDGPYFGFRIKGEENKYYYVWLDAPVGYISSLANYLGNDVSKALGAWSSAKVVHVIGKDIVYFHFLFWPAMLMAADMKLPHSIVVHGFLTVNGEKMSKSRGTFLTARDFLQKYNAEYLRYYYASLLSMKMQDIDLNFKSFQESVHGELVGNIANFAYRVMNFAEKNYSGLISHAAIDEDIKKRLHDLYALIAQAYEKFDFREAVALINKCSAEGNRYFQGLEPWKLIKEDREAVEGVLGFALNMIRNLSIVLSPVLPVYAKELQSQLGLDAHGGMTWHDIGFKTSSFKLHHPKILLERFEIEQKRIFPLDLRVAKVLSAQPHPDAQKLLVLQIDLGSEKRQLVAGLREYYTTEQLVGKNIIIVANLKPAKLRGVMSQGMLLAGSNADDSRVIIVQAPKSQPGDQACVEGSEPSKDMIDYEQFLKTVLSVKDKRVMAGSHPLKTAHEEVSCDIEDGAKVR